MDLKVEKDLRYELIKHSKRADALIALAERENRDLYDAEMDELDEINLRAEQIDDELARRDPSYQRQLGRRTAPNTPSNSHAQTYASAGGAGVIVGETKEGRQVRAYRPHEPLPVLGSVNYSFADWVRAAYSGDYSKIRAALTEGVDASGGFTVPHPLSAAILEIARNKAQVMRAGALTVPMESSTLDFARQLTDPVAHWRGELVSLTPSGLTFDKIQFRAHVVGALVNLSEELLMDSPNIGSLLQTSLGTALGLALDKAGLAGSGAGAEPQGVIGTTGIEQVTAVGALADYVPFSQAITKLWTNNFQPTALLYNSLVAGKLDLLVDGEGRPLLPPPSWGTYAHLMTNQLEDNAGASIAVLGDFSQLWLGMRSQLHIQFDRSATVGSVNAFTDLAVNVRAWMRADSIAVRPGAFCTLEGITTT